MLDATFSEFYFSKGQILQKLIHDLKYKGNKEKVVNAVLDDYKHDSNPLEYKEQFEEYSKPYNRNKNQKEPGTGLGLNICIAILKEHGFDISSEKNEIGTKIKIKIKRYYWIKRK